MFQVRESGLGTRDVEERTKASYVCYEHFLYHKRLFVARKKQSLTVLLKPVKQGINDSNAQLLPNLFEMF